MMTLPMPTDGGVEGADFVPSTRASLHHSESLLRVPEVAERLNVAPKTVYKYVATGGLPCIRLQNRTLRFSPQQVQV
jgi:excisionase family DNA binding protein